MKTSFFVALVVLPLGPAMALDTSRAVSQYGHTAWRMQDGFFPSAPNAIAQTTDGYLWVGTGAGLLRFDGVQFVPWAAPRNHSALVIYSLLGSRDGSLWIGTERDGLARWRNGDLTFFKSSGRINRLLEGPDGNVWLTRSRISADPICRADANEVHCYGRSEGIPSPTAGPLVKDRQGNFWLGTSLGVTRWRQGTATDFPIDKLKQNNGLGGVMGLAVLDDGSILVGLLRTGPRLGLQRLVDGTLKDFILPDLDGTKLDVNCLMIDRDGALWIGTFEHGIYHVRSSGVDNFRSADGLSSDSIEDFFEDREGNVWVTTSKGIDQFHDLPIATISRREGLNADRVTSVLASREGTVWIGATGALNVLRNGIIPAVRPRDSLSGEMVTSLLEDRDGRLWVGVDRELQVYDGAAYHPIRRPDSSALGIVLALAEDTDRNIWASVIGKSRTLVRIRRREVQEEIAQDKIPPANALAADPVHGIWLGLDNGALARYRDGVLDVFQSPASSIFHVYVDSHGSTWATAKEGLLWWKDGTLRTLDSSSGLPCDSMIDAIEDDHGSLWVFARCGMMSIAYADLEKWRKQSTWKLNPRVFDTLDGAQPGRSSFQPGASRSRDGRIWFATETVLQMVDPRRLDKNRVPPPVHVEQVIADRKAYQAKQGLRLPALTSDLEIDYTGLSFSVPRKVRFRYKLDGRDRNWQDAETRRQAFYSDLAPGSYRFQVIACNSNGVWNESGAALSFSIAPAYYQTAWFRALSAALALSLCWGLYRLRVRQIAARIDLRFDERLAERTRLAREIHDTLLQTIQGSKLVADDALDSPDPARMRRALQRLSAWLEQATQEGRVALSSLRSSTTQRNDLAEAFQRAGEDCLLKKTVNFRLTVEGASRAMHPIVRDDVYRIGIEAIRNACAHSEGSDVDVSLAYARNLVLRVRDNGRGIDPEVLARGKDNHFGLAGMRERAERAGARLSFHARNPGTEVELFVPGSLCFRNPTPLSQALAKLRRSLHLKG